eukprot:gene944-33931_t
MPKARVNTRLLGGPTMMPKARVNAQLLGDPTMVNRPSIPTAAHSQSASRHSQSARHSVAALKAYGSPSARGYSGLQMPCHRQPGMSDAMHPNPNPSVTDRLRGKSTSVGVLGGGFQTLRPQTAPAGHPYGSSPPKHQSYRSVDPSGRPRSPGLGTPTRPSTKPDLRVGSPSTPFTPSTLSGSPRAGHSHPHIPNFKSEISVGKLASTASVDHHSPRVQSSGEIHFTQTVPMDAHTKEMWSDMLLKRSIMSGSAQRRKESARSERFSSSTITQMQQRGNCQPYRVSGFSEPEVKGGKPDPEDTSWAFSTVGQRAMESAPVLTVSLHSALGKSADSHQPGAADPALRRSFSHRQSTLPVVPEEDLSRLSPMPDDEDYARSEVPSSPLREGGEEEEEEDSLVQLVCLHVPAEFASNADGEMLSPVAEEPGSYNVAEGPSLPATGKVSDSTTTPPPVPMPSADGLGQDGDEYGDFVRDDEGEGEDEDGYGGFVQEDDDGGGSGEEDEVEEAIKRVAESQNNAKLNAVSDPASDCISSRSSSGLHVFDASMLDSIAEGCEAGSRAPSIGGGRGSPQVAGEAPFIEVGCEAGSRAPSIEGGRGSPRVADEGMGEGDLNFSIGGGRVSADVEGRGEGDLHSSIGGGRVTAEVEGRGEGEGASMHALDESLSQSPQPYGGTCGGSERGGRSSPSEGRMHLGSERAPSDMVNTDMVSTAHEPVSEAEGVTHSGVVDGDWVDDGDGNRAENDGTVEAIDAGAWGEGGVQSIDARALSEEGGQSIDTQGVSKGGVQPIDAIVLSEGGVQSINARALSEGGVQSIDTQGVSDVNVASREEDSLQTSSSPENDLTEELDQEVCSLLHKSDSNTGAKLAGVVGAKPVGGVGGERSIGFDEGEFSDDLGIQAKPVGVVDGGTSPGRDEPMDVVGGGRSSGCDEPAGVVGGVCSPGCDEGKFSEDLGIQADPGGDSQVEDQFGASGEGRGEPLSRPSSLNSTGRPASGRPTSARPTSARPSPRPTSGRPSSGASSRPNSGRLSGDAPSPIAEVPSVGDLQVIEEDDGEVDPMGERHAVEEGEGGAALMAGLQAVDEGEEGEGYGSHGVGLEVIHEDEGGVPHNRGLGVLEEGEEEEEEIDPMGSLDVIEEEKEEEEEEEEEE